MILCSLLFIFIQNSYGQDDFKNDLIKNAKTKPSKEVTVSTNIYVRLISDLDLSKNTFSVDLTLRQSWQDDRVAFTESPSLSYLTLEAEETTKIWRPDTFIQNGISTNFHSAPRENALIRIYPNGNVFYSLRLFATLYCATNKRTFPFDDQVCDIKLASYGYTTADITYVWRNTNPIQINTDGVEGLNNYELINVDSKTCDTKTNTGEYSCLKAVFTLSSISCQHLMRIYIPSVFFLLLAWAPFWMERRNGALGIGFVVGLGALISFLVLTTGPMPLQAVSAHTTALDVWVFAHLIFLVMALGHSVLVSWYGVEDYKTRRMDGVARILHPLLYIVFNIVYWVFYLIIFK